MYMRTFSSRARYQWYLFYIYLTKFRGKRGEVKGPFGIYTFSISVCFFKEIKIENLHVVVYGYQNGQQILLLYSLR